MSRIEYACEYKDQHNGIIYGIVYNTYEEALINIKEAGELYLESLENEEKRIIENKTTSIVPMVLANA